MVYARVIVNPAAGAGRTARKWPQIKCLLKDMGLRFDDELTEAPGHAIELARLAVKRGYETVVAVGGDGTTNEIVNGLYDAGSMKDIKLGIIATGTGSDYVRTMGIPENYRLACRKLLNPCTVHVDVGIVEYSVREAAKKRLFVNFAGVGIDAEIVKATTIKFKKLGGLPAYLMGLLSVCAVYRNHRVCISIDNQAENNRKICTTLINIGKYGGGRMKVAPCADPADGLFDIVVIEDLSKPDLLFSLPRIYRGTHLSHPRVRLLKAKEIAIKPELPLSLQADGEYLGNAPARFRILPNSLTVLT